MLSIHVKRGKASGQTDWILHSDNNVVAGLNLRIRRTIIISTGRRISSVRRRRSFAERIRSRDDRRTKRGKPMETRGHEIGAADTKSSARGPGWRRICDGGLYCRRVSGERRKETNPTPKKLYAPRINRCVKILSPLTGGGISPACFLNFSNEIWDCR